MFRNLDETQKFLLEELGTSDVGVVKDILTGLSKRASEIAKRGRATEEDMSSNVERVARQLQLTGTLPDPQKASIERVYDFSFAKRAYEEIEARQWDPKKYHYSRK